MSSDFPFDNYDITPNAQAEAADWEIESLTKLLDTQVEGEKVVAQHTFTYPGDRFKISLARVVPYVFQQGGVWLEEVPVPPRAEDFLNYEGSRLDFHVELSDRGTSKNYKYAGSGFRLLATPDGDAYAVRNFFDEKNAGITNENGQEKPLSTHVSDGLGVSELVGEALENLLPRLSAIDWRKPVSVDQRATILSYLMSTSHAVLWNSRYNLHTEARTQEIVEQLVALSTQLCPKLQGNLEQATDELPSRDINEQSNTRTLEIKEDILANDSLGKEVRRRVSITPKIVKASEPTRVLYFMQDGSVHHASAVLRHGPLGDRRDVEVRNVTIDDVQIFSDIIRAAVRLPSRDN